MDFDWSRFTEDSFREMRKIIVESRMDDYFTEGRLGFLQCGVIEAEFRLQEDADDEFLITLNYRTPTADGLEGSSWRYDSDCLYYEFRENMESLFAADMKNIPQLAACAGQPANGGDKS
ncbi:MAG: hypothetical protein IJS96_05035 [Schwartzia sp.]|nr:hypothetical protein [Schwartzia sp. (in: firmicutes)]